MTPSNFTYLDAADNLVTHVLEGRLVQNSWHDTTEDGKKVACMLGAMHAGIKNTSDCPSTVMPDWMAQVIPGAFDSLPSNTFNDVAIRFSEFLIRFGEIEDWEAVHRAYTVAYIMTITGADRYAPLIALINEGQKNGSPDHILLSASGTMSDEFYDLRYQVNDYLVEYGYGRMPDANKLFFPTLFSVLPIFLATEPERVFNFDATVTTRTTTQTSVIATNVIQARILAAKTSAKGAELTLVAKPKVKLPSYVVAARDHQSDCPSFYGNGDGTWSAAQDWAVENGAERSALHNTTAIRSWLKANFPA